MDQTLASIFFKRTAQLSAAPAVRFKEGRAPYRDLSWSEFGRLVEEMAFGLACLGVKAGSSAAIVSQTSHLWVASDLAIIANGAISVPVYPTSSQADLRFILANSASQVVFVQNESLLKKVLSVHEQLPNLTKVVLLSSPSQGRSLTELGLDTEIVIGLEELQELGRERRMVEPSLIEERMAAVELADPATIIYTSGTTGTPKGVILSHANIVSVLEDLTQVIPVSEHDVYLSFLPLSHVFERICGEFYWMHSGGVCAFAEGIESVGKNMAETQPSMILVVPRVLDRIYAKVKSGIQGASGRARQLIEWALKVGKEIVEHKAEGKTPRPGLTAKHWLAERLVFRKLRARIGKNLRMVVSGGAPATPEVIEFFNAIGISTLEGYGLTETTAPVSVNRHGKVKIGTVGPALPSVQVKIAEDGEILIKGPTVFNGYFKADALTAAVFEEGWFHSGDIGVIDGDGYLKITDRKKDLIVNSAGKNIAPQRVEAVLKTLPHVTQAIVFGDRKKHLVSILTLEEQAVTEFAHDQGWNFKGYQELVQLPNLRQFLRSEINERSASLADYERVRNFAILPADLSVEAGELTATLKIKRNVVREKYRELVESLYREEDAPALVSSAR